MGPKKRKATAAAVDENHDPFRLADLPTQNLVSVKKKTKGAQWTVGEDDALCVAYVSSSETHRGTDMRLAPGKDEAADTADQTFWGNIHKLFVQRTGSTQRSRMYLHAYKFTFSYAFTCAV